MGRESFSIQAAARPKSSRRWLAFSGILDIGPSVLEAVGCKLANCREDLSRLVESLVRPGASRLWSLCLHGAPGTGKSLFARHLASRIGMEVMQQRASDLLSKWLGESEQNIAGAFQAARFQSPMRKLEPPDA
jgi:SpoVK/Ycf46/Vps4 family AAA+-type ATPase